MSGHVLTLRKHYEWASWHASCSCGWSGRPELSRPDAIRHHTVHVSGFPERRVARRQEAVVEAQRRLVFPGVVAAVAGLFVLILAVAL